MRKKNYMNYNCFLISQWDNHKIIVLKHWTPNHKSIISLKEIHQWSSPFNHWFSILSCNKNWSTCHIDIGIWNLHGDLANVAWTLVICLTLNYMQHLKEINMKNKRTKIYRISSNVLHIINNVDMAPFKSFVHFKVFII